MKFPLLLLAFLFLVSVPTLSAVQSTGVLEVVVEDPFGVPVAGAEVVAVSLSGYREAVVTDEAGRAVFGALVTGSYAVEAFARYGRAAPVDVVVAGPPVLVDLRLVPDVAPGVLVRPVDAQGLPLPGALVTAVGPGGDTREQVAGSLGVAPLAGLRPGSWRLDVALPGFVGSGADVEVAYGPPRVVELPLTLAGFGEIVVVSATRTPVRLLEAPVTTSVLGAGRIATAAVTDVPELLRAVPGVNVLQLSARDFSLTTRGATGPAANSQLVLVDGRSVYLDFYGLVLWDALSFNQSDVEQIEVVRGPASATWGANAMTGAVNIITREPRQSVGSQLSFWGGVHDRDAGSTAGLGPGTLYGSNATVTRAVGSDMAYRISAGHYRSDGYPRPVGRVPRIDDPRVEGRQVGGAVFQDLPIPAASALKFDARLDHRVHGGRGRLSYSGGVATPEGTTHTGLGPFDIQGGYFGYAKVNYERDALSVQVFANLLDGFAPSQLFPDNHLSFVSRLVDGEVVHRSTVGRHRFTYGGSLRRVGFDIDIAPGAPHRTEFAGFFQDEFDTDRFRLSAAARLDKFGNIAEPFFSPRVALGLKLGPDHVVTGSYNRAFRAPSAVETHLDHSVVVPLDLSPLALLRPLLPALVPSGLSAAGRDAALADLGEALDATTSAPFPLHTRAVGASVPYYTGEAPLPLVEESVDSYELSYAGTVGPWRTGLGAAVYRSDFSDGIGFLELDTDVDPYTEQVPPPGWLLPARLIPLLAAFGGSFPRTSLVFTNVGALTQRGVELWSEQRVGAAGSLWANYSWQAAPSVPAGSGYDVTRLSLPPPHRFNLGVAFNGRRALGDLAVHHAANAFWSDILTSEFHGYSPAYTMVNVSAGLKWREGRMTTLLRITNLFNRTLRQHIFGDLLRRSVVGELRLSLP